MAEQTTLAKITAEIASSLKKELDEPFKRILADKVKAWRSTLLRRTLQQNPNERVHFRQKIYVKFVKSSPLDSCTDGPVCDIMKSTLPIPVPVRTGEMLFDYVGSIDGKNAFKRKEPGMSYYMTKGKYSKDLVLWELTNNYLEIENAIGLPAARMDGVFDNPEEVSKFNCSTDGGCDFWNEPYPVSGDIKQAIVQCILEVDFQQKVTPSNKEIEVTPQKQEHEPDGR